MSLSEEKAGLLALWEERRKEFEQCHELQTFLRDAEQMDNWMAKQEVSYDIIAITLHTHLHMHACRHTIMIWFSYIQGFLAAEEDGDSLDTVEALIKKHDNFEKSLEAQEEKFKVYIDMIYMIQWTLDLCVNY